MKTISIYISCLILIFSGAGCKKFLDIKPDTNTDINPHLIADLEQMLNNSELSAPNYLLADMMSDDVMLSDNLLSTYSSSYYIKAYQWWSTIWDASEEDPMYNGAYRMILQMNIILDRIAAAPNGTPAQKNIVYAQAKINRAYYYFQLANLYGPGYNATTAASDLAVPLVLKPDAALLPARATIQKVYAQVLQDLKDALNTTDLPNFGIDVIHPGRAAALALQARVYLFMGDYNQALIAANAALQIKSSVLDYNTFSLIDGVNPSNGILNKPLTLTDETTNPECLLARICTDNDFYPKFITTPFISDELEELFGDTDLRLVYNFTPGTANNRATYLTNNGSSMFFNYGIGVPEMLLIKAECLARNGDATSALTPLEMIRKFRYKPSDYAPLVNNGADYALKQILAERRKELFLHGGLRLFDLKRLNKDSRFSKDVLRFSEADGHTIAILKPGSPNYLAPFSPQVIAANPSMIQNPRSTITKP